MISRIKQWLCAHDYVIETKMGLDVDLLRNYGIRREVPIEHNERCKKCNKHIPIVTRTFVYCNIDKTPD